MSFLLQLPRSAWLIYRMHLGTILGSRRSLAGIALAAIPPLFAFLAIQFSPESESSQGIFGVLGYFLLIAFIVPMLSVALGVGVVADEAESRTITYPFTRPIPRSALFIGRWFASLTAILALIAASAAGMAVAVTVSQKGEAPTPELLRGVFQAALVGGVVYSVGAALVGVLFKRGLVIALGYVVAVEALLSFVPGSAQKLTVQYHLRSMFVELGLPIWEELEEMGIVEFLDPDVALRKMMMVSGVFLVLGCIVVTRKQFVLSS